MFTTRVFILAVSPHTTIVYGVLKWVIKNLCEKMREMKGFSKYIFTQFLSFKNNLFAREISCHNIVESQLQSYKVLILKE